MRRSGGRCAETGRMVSSHRGRMFSATGNVVRGNDTRKCAFTIKTRTAFVISLTYTLTFGAGREVLLVMPGGKTVSGFSPRTVIRVPYLIKDGKPRPLTMKGVPRFRGKLVRRRMTIRGLAMST